MTSQISPRAVFFGVVQLILGHDDLEEPLVSEGVERSRVSGERPHRGQKILKHGMVGIALVGLDERLNAGQGLVAPHLVQEHPEDPAPLVIGDSRVAGPFAVIFTSGRSESACRLLP